MNRYEVGAHDRPFCTVDDIEVAEKAADALLKREPGVAWITDTQTGLTIEIVERRVQERRRVERRAA